MNIPFRQLLILCGMLCGSIVSAQLTIWLTEVPDDTPPQPSIYIAGNFNNWNPGDENYLLTDHQDGTYSITFHPSPGTLEFKFTRGSWETVEGTAKGNFRPNRTFSYNGTPTTTELTIDGWEDISGKHTSADNVEILYTNFAIPQLNRTRRIWLYLPPDYHTSTKRYPVIYMHDGQNLFDAFYSFAGEWRVDESLNDLFAQGDYGAIVVGIDNGGGSRFDEYCPWINPQYGGGEGDEYVAFLVETLKPHIDSLYRTLPSAEYTAIAGSSMGGLISMYAAAAYPDVFAKAGVFSPAFWVADSLYSFCEGQQLDDALRVYFVASENESNSMIPDMQEMYDVLIAEGIEADELFFLNESDGAHSEWFWAREFPDAYTWLFQDLVLSTNAPAQKKIEVVPNPASDFILLPVDGPVTFQMYNYQGSIIREGTHPDGHIPIQTYAPGPYWVKWMDQKGMSYTRSFVKI